METIAALIFMFGCGIFIFLVAFVFGWVKALLALFFFVVGFFISVIGDIDNLFLSQTYIGLIDVFIEFFVSFIDVFKGSWKWARYENPLAAFIAGALSLGFIYSR